MTWIEHLSTELIARRVPRRTRARIMLELEDHIACDPESRSELVVPLIENGSVLGVLDLDSPLPARFDDMDRQGCEQLVALFLGQCRQYSNCHKGAILVTAHGISDRIPSCGGGAK